MEGTATETGESFFKALVANLSKSMGTMGAWVAVYVESDRVLRAVSMKMRDEWREGFEYPAEWVYEGRAWSELYLVRAFLQYNDAFEILLWPNLLAMLDHHDIVRRFPQAELNIGGSLWLRKVR